MEHKANTANMDRARGSYDWNRRSCLGKEGWWQNPLQYRSPRNRAHHAHRPSEISKQSSSDFSAYIGQLHTPLWASRRKQRLKWARPCAKTESWSEFPGSSLWFIISLSHTPPGSPICLLHSTIIFVPSESTWGLNGFKFPFLHLY